MTTWVLLRGLAREARHWSGFAAALQTRVPRGDAVVAPDFPGNGARWREPSALTVGALAAAARAQVRASDHRQPYVLVALSLGGMAAVDWTAHWPREVGGCVLINSSLAGLSPVWERLRPGALPVLLAVLLARTPLQRERRIAALTTSLRADTEQLATRWAQFARDAPVTTRNAVRQLVAALRFRVPGHRPAVPTLVLASSADRLVSPLCSVAIARHWRVPLRLHPTAGHDLPLDDPQWVLARIGDWWADLQHASTPHAD